MVGTMRWQIRPWTEADTDGLHRLVRESIKELSAWLPWCDEGYSRRDTEGWIAHCRTSWAAQAEFPMGVFETATGEPVGGVGINKIDASARSANLGYWTGTPWLGLGVARAAAMQAADFAFLELRIERLDIVIHPQNLPSRRVAEAIGARLTGIVPQRLAFRGAWVDAAVYELRRSL